MDTLSLSLNFELPTGQPPEWLLLLPAGEFSGRDGRAWSNPDPQAVLNAFARGGIPLPIDLEHATEIKAPKGGAAPAVGFVAELQARNGEVWGKADWNGDGVFPTPVGMNRRLSSARAEPFCVPHARGDEPPDRAVFTFWFLCSPRPWG